MPLPIHILQCASTLVRRHIGSFAIETGGIFSTVQSRHHSTLSSDPQYISIQPKVHMSLPDNNTVHSSKPLRPALTFALPAKPNFAVELPVYNNSRSTQVESQYRPSVERSRRNDDSSQPRSPPRRDHDTYASSSSRSWRGTDSYRARSRSPRRDTDTYIPHSPTGRETDRYNPDRSPPRRAITGRNSPIDDRKSLRTWTDSYRPDKLVKRRDYSTSLSRSPEKRGRRLSTPDSRDRSRSLSSQRYRPSKKEKDFRKETPRGQSKERLNPVEKTRSVNMLGRDGH